MQSSKPALAANLPANYQTRELTSLVDEHLSGGEVVGGWEKDKRGRTGGIKIKRKGIQGCRKKR
jgi:hypothetical protein